VNCQGTSAAFEPGRRFSRRATQCALEVQNAQSPSKMTKGTSRTSIATLSTYPPPVSLICMTTLR
jgi:hypothetical protein